MNNNLNNVAFPIFNSDGECAAYSMGFSKHELGALMIAQGLVAKYNLKSPEDQKTIARLSYELSAEILYQFK